jgi:hypothetical protein
MATVFKVVLSGHNYNAYTDTNPNHFSLYVDQLVDYVLIKEKPPETVSVNGTVNIAHGLGYVPFCLVFAETSSGVWRKLFSTPIDGVGYSFSIDSTNLVLSNTTGIAKNFSYHIFYDNIT